jgi:2-polyprenyl-6-methoxyphenol hydroxylase-like FAD-dependent oxidoreductase
VDTPLVLIVGAGPTGMTMAIEAQRAGLAVRIIDKSDHTARHSQALVVQARTLEQLQRYGIADIAVARGRKLTRVNFWSGRKHIMSFGFERIPSRYPYFLFLPQNETEAILNDHMESLGIRTERGVELTSFTQREDSVRATIRHQDGREETLEPRWTVGCDGAHSTVRKLASIPFEGEGIPTSFFLGDMELDGPDVPNHDLRLYFHTGGDVVFMGRLTDRLTRLIVALHSEQRRNRNQELSIRDFQDAVDRADVRVTVRNGEWMTPFHVEDLQAKRYRLQNVFLAGDAAHIHSPVGGQGMNTGIQDAANLAWKLAAAARGADAAVVGSYEIERAEVGKALVRFTGRGLKLATSGNRLLEHLRDALLPLVSHPAFVQKAVLGFISETAINYRSSPISEDHGGDGSLEPGDRMPDLVIASNGHRTALLRDWSDGKYLALVINSADPVPQEIAALKHVKVIRLNDAELDEDGRRQLGPSPKLLLVRPDGYIGFRAPLGKITGTDQELRSYAERLALA